MLNEIRAFISYSQIRGELGYWGTPSDSEVDLVWARGKRAVGFEFKSGKKWKSEFGGGLRTLLEAKKIDKAIGIYCGDDRIKGGPIVVLPWREFLKKLHQGEIIEA